MGGCERFTIVTWRLTSHTHADPTEKSCVTYAASGVGLTQNHSVGFTIINNRGSLAVSNMGFTQAQIAAASE